jgi:hypothetical protein
MGWVKTVKVLINGDTYSENQANPLGNLVEVRNQHHGKLWATLANFE